jgi:Flp pilus assembly pilin Flp
MSTFARKIRGFLTSENGPTAAECAVLLAPIIFMALTAIQSLGANTSTTFADVGNVAGCR